MNPKIWLSSPHMGGEELKFVNDAFDTNWIAPLGPNVNNFEKDLSDYTGVKHAAALSSGTAAIHLALIILGVEKDDEVICQSFTFSASANPIAYQQAKPVFIDSEEESWNMDPNLLEEAIKDRISKGKRPKAIIAVHLYGMPAKLNDLIAISEKYEIPIIEDAAEALGSKCLSREIRSISHSGPSPKMINNDTNVVDIKAISRDKWKAAGSFGQFGILSFNGNKIITTSGGGALLSNNDEYIKKARFLATQARDDAPHYEHTHIGYNYRMSNVLAGIGRGQMEVLDKRVAQRRDNFEFYKENIGYLPGLYFQPELESSFSNRWLTSIIIDPNLSNGITRETVRLALEKENIESRPLWKPMHIQPVFKDCKFYGNGVSEKLFDNGLCLPSGSNLTMEDLERVVKIIKATFN